MLRGRTRVLNACQRCRKQKIRCTGTHPCRACSGRSLTCDFGAEEKQVVISEKELFDLRLRMSQLEKALQERHDTNLSINPLRTDIHHHETVSETNLTQPQKASKKSGLYSSRHSSSSHSSQDQNNLEHIHVSNPLVPEQPVYISESTGKLRYLGHSSGYAFTQRVLHLLQQDPPSNPSPEIAWNLAGQEQKAEPGRLVPLSSPDVSKLPSRGIAIHYLQCLRFRTEPLFYLFDESDFVSRLHHFYKSPMEYAQSSLVWFMHYLVLMAFGKALDPHTQKDMSTSSPVPELFTRALKSLPDMTYLCDHPVEGTELFCSIALYLQSINHRQAAAVYIGQAIRLAQLYALHLDLQESIIGTHAVERCRRVWWTVYALNQRFTSNLGLPNFINDTDMKSPLPIISDVDEDVTALAIHVKICQLLGLLVSTVYPSAEDPQISFVSATRRVLRGAARIKNHIEQYLDRCFGEISRVAAHLELAYYHCITLACRPVLFYLLKLRTGDGYDAHYLSQPSSMTGLIQVCVDSASQAIKVLSQLQEHDLLDTFLPFDLESAFSATFVLAMAVGIDSEVLAQPRAIQAAKKVINTIADRGNIQAKLRMLEIEQLEESLSRQSRVAQRNRNFDHFQDASATLSPILQPGPTAVPHLIAPFFNDWNFNAALSGDQIMSLADALDTVDFDAFNSMSS